MRLKMLRMRTLIGSVYAWNWKDGLRNPGHWIHGGIYWNAWMRYWGLWERWGAAESTPLFNDGDSWYLHEADFCASLTPSHRNLTRKLQGWMRRPLLHHISLLPIHSPDTGRRVQTNPLYILVMYIEFPHSRQKRTLDTNEAISWREENRKDLSSS